MYKYLTSFALLFSSMANAQVKDWQAGVKMDNMLFSSYILAHAGWDDNENDTLNVEGKPFYIITEDGTSQVGVELDKPGRRQDRAAALRDQHVQCLSRQIRQRQLRRLPQDQLQIRFHAEPYPAGAGQPGLCAVGQ